MPPNMRMGKRHNIFQVDTVDGEPDSTNSEDWRLGKVWILRGSKFSTSNYGARNPSAPIETVLKLPMAFAALDECLGTFSVVSG